MTTVLVTGATGSLGSAVSRRLIEQGAAVVALVAPGDGPGGLHRHTGDYEPRCGDVRDAAALRRAMRHVDEVYHLAGVAAPFNRLRPLMEQVNVAGAANVARAAADAGVSRLVHTSSIAAIGYPSPGERADESFDFARSVVRNSYMLTKRSGEQAVLAVGDQTGLPVVVVNPAAVIAPYSHRRHGWASLVERARRGRLRVYPPGGVSVCSVRDLVDGQLAAMRTGRPGERYILTTADLSYRELFTLACQVVHARPPRRGAPAAAVRLAGRFGQMLAHLYRDAARSPVLVPENAELAVRMFCYDSGKARRELNLIADGIGSIRASIAEVDRWLAKGDHGARTGTGRA
jgi:dihydroflavonol-4-reductase